VLSGSHIPCAGHCSVVLQDLHKPGRKSRSVFQDRPVLEAPFRDCKRRGVRRCMISSKHRIKHRIDAVPSRASCKPHCSAYHRTHTRHMTLPDFLVSSCFMLHASRWRHVYTKSQKPKAKSQKPKAKRHQTFATASVFSTGGSSSGLVESHSCLYFQEPADICTRSILSKSVR